MFFEIGSKPLADMGVLPRKPSDIDWFGPTRNAKNILSRVFPRGYEVFSENNHKLIVKAFTSKGHVMVEIENSDENENNRHIYRHMLMEHANSVTPAGLVRPASLDMLLFFKESHKYKKNSVHFLKTLQDIILLKSLGAKIPSTMSDLLAERERLTYTNKLPVLDVGKKEFFNPQTVTYKYDHDDLHVAVALLDKPAYTFYIDPNKQVMCSQQRFNECPGVVKLFGVVEESMVLALERSLIPFDFKPDPDKAFSTALEKVCTSITSGWFREYAYNHYWEAQAAYRTVNKDKHYVDRFKEALAGGKIKLFEHSETTSPY